MKPREPRCSVVIPARLRRDGQWSDVRIRNLSSRGLGIETEFAIKRGAYVEIFRQDQIIVGRVMWSRGPNAGLRTQDMIDIAGLLHGNPSPTLADLRHCHVDRRRVAREPPADRAERSRRTSSMIQYAFLAIAAGGGAVVAGHAVQARLAAPLAFVSARL